jgi:hypothetical protein
MEKINLPEEIEAQFIALAKSKGVYLEGNIIKMLEDDHPDFKAYLEEALEKDAENRKKRLEMTKQVQDQNKVLEQRAKENDRLMAELKDFTKQIQDQNRELQYKAEENDKLMKDIKVALGVAEKAKEDALNDLSVAQQRTQFELIGTIVKVALFVIVTVGFITTGMYTMAMITESTETTLIGNTWSNLFGILLTNSFSIIGTIMGVKYAQNEKEGKESK